jgi:hypothetical protein
VLTRPWYPEAADLPLLHVPDKDRKHIQSLLAPSLPQTGSSRLGVEDKGFCWQIAQELVLAVEDREIKYIEGVWMSQYQLECAETPQPHAWAIVGGQRIDLIGELLCRVTKATVNELWYEPLVEFFPTPFSYDQLSAAIKTFPCWMRGNENLSIAAASNSLVQNKILKYEDIFKYVFKPAADRLIERFRKSLVTDR